jgi:hypothetical protein
MSKNYSSRRSSSWRSHAQVLLCQLSNPAGQTEQLMSKLWSKAVVTNLFFELSLTFHVQGFRGRQNLTCCLVVPFTDTDRGTIRGRDTDKYRERETDSDTDNDTNKDRDTDTGTDTDKGHGQRHGCGKLKKLRVWSEWQKPS